jgi:hypothetical protein
MIIVQFLAVFLPFAAWRDASGQVRRPRQGDMKTGLQFKLSEGTPASGKTQALPIAPASQLSDSDAQSVIARLQPIKSDPSDDQQFALRDRSLPPPRTGKTIQASFPPPEVKTAPDTATGPLEVVRYLPEGDVPIAPQLSVTFSQPMVAVTSLRTRPALSDGDRIPRRNSRWHEIGHRSLSCRSA